MGLSGQDFKNFLMKFDFQKVLIKYSSLMSTPSVPFWKIALVLIFGAILLLICFKTPDATNISNPGVFMELPSKVSNYWGFHMDPTPAEVNGLPPDTEFVRKEYESPEGDRIMCSIVLSGANKRSIHRPEACLPGQGWTIKSGEVLPIELSTGQKIEVMNLTLARPVELPDGKKKTLNSYYFYWFVGHDRTTPSHKSRIFFTSWDRVFKQENHRWAYCIIHSKVTQGWGLPERDATQTLELMKKFAGQIIPTFQKSFFIQSAPSEPSITP